MKLLDLFCGAGGCAVGYHRAGFTDIIGVDIRPQPRYPFAFVQADALTYLAEHGQEFDVIHASPPCQRFSVAGNVQRANGWYSDKHPDLIGPVRSLLLGKPYIIENVPAAPLINPVMLCGTMFSLHVYRHRLFESNLALTAPAHPKHTESTGSHRRPKGYRNRLGKSYPMGNFITVAGHNFEMLSASEAMGIHWMKVRRELAEAIPPAYTEFLGRQIIKQLQREHKIAS